MNFVERGYIFAVLATYQLRGLFLRGCLFPLFAAYLLRGGFSKFSKKFEIPGQIRRFRYGIKMRGNVTTAPTISP